MADHDHAGDFNPFCRACGQAGQALTAEDTKKLLPRAPVRPSLPIGAARLAQIRARYEAATEGPWEEQWRPAHKAPGYEVSDLGNVRSYLNKGNHKKKHAGHPRLLKLQKKGPYLTASLPNTHGNYQHFSVHCLVMRAFVGEPPDGTEVAHLNGVGSDNRLSNLVYVSHKENESHKKAHGTDPVGERNSQAKLLGRQVAEIRYLASRGIPQAKIGALFGLDHKAVSEILCARNWGHIDSRPDVLELIARVAAAEARVSELEREVAHLEGKDLK